MSAPRGLLVSQVGYDIGLPMRALVRGPAGTLSPLATFAIEDGQATRVREGRMEPWGECWGSFWWVADFSGLSLPGTYRLDLMDHGRSVFPAEAFDVDHALLRKQTLPWVGVDQAERRARLAMNRVGWQDCGASWQEANSHAVYLLGFCDLLQASDAARSAGDEERIARQIVNGCDYLAMLQDRAEALGLGLGAVSHQIPKFEEVALVGDASKAAAAWARAAACLPPAFALKKSEYRGRAEKALAWLVARGPRVPLAFHAGIHGADPDLVPPAEWITRDLWMMVRAAVSLAEHEGDAHARQACAWTNLLLARQLAPTEAEHGFYGHFRSFDTNGCTEKTWVHHIEGGVIGDDAGGHVPHDLLPLLRMLERWPRHADAARWRQALRDFAYGFFIPACEANPFFLLPQGVYPDEGLLSFAGLWHGMNAAYAHAAVLAMELDRLFPDPAFARIATGNLQWIAGLHAGLTADSLFASHMFQCPVPAGTALPVSMICGIGRRFAGNWLNVRGAICNGFSTGDQFRFDVPSLRRHDVPSAFTDEDWISHAGAWLSAMALHPPAISDPVARTPQDRP